MKNKAVACRPKSAGEKKPTIDTAVTAPVGSSKTVGILMSNTRKSMSKKLRFEVFKRDGFTCQYCGAHPPSAILHVDHIHPVSKGGGDDIDNLITACQPCNSGKSNVELTDVPQSLQDKAALVLEREAQIQGYQSVMDAKRLRLEEEAAQVCEVYETFNPGFTLTDKSMVTVRMFIDKLGVHFVQSAMELAWTARKVRRGGEFKYFCGICWNKIKGKSHDE